MTKCAPVFTRQIWIVFDNADGGRLGCQWLTSVHGHDMSDQRAVAPSPATSRALSARHEVRDRLSRFYISKLSHRFDRYILPSFILQLCACLTPPLEIRLSSGYLFCHGCHPAPNYTGTIGAHSSARFICARSGRGHWRPRSHRRGTLIRLHA